MKWPTYPLDEIIDHISNREEKVKRICISMITRKRSVVDTKTVCSRLRSSFDIPVSLLISPTLVKPEDLLDFKTAGADKICVAIDLATSELFDRFRGKGVGGPHQWKTYWECLSHALFVFGHGNAGAHFMVGMGETEKQMCEAIQRVRDMEGRTHLFSFYPEVNSEMTEGTPPPIAPRLEIIPGEPPTIVRDEFGNALGGIRLPHVDVPTGRHIGVGGTPLIYCNLLPGFDAFDDETLDVLYPNHGSYVSQFNRATTRAVKAGYLLKYDAKELRREAAQSYIGK